MLYIIFEILEINPGTRVILEPSTRVGNRVPGKITTKAYPRLDMNSLFLLYSFIYTLFMSTISNGVYIIYYHACNETARSVDFITNEYSILF